MNASGMNLTFVKIIDNGDDNCKPGRFLYANCVSMMVRTTEEADGEQSFWDGAIK